MFKKAAWAVFGLALALVFAAPQKAAAEVHVGVAIGAPAVYGSVEVAPAPYVAYPQTYVYSEPYVAYDAPVYYGGYYYDRPYWRSGHSYYRGGRGWHDRGHYAHEYGHRGDGRWGHRR